MVYIAFSYLGLICLGFIDNARGPVYPQILHYFQITKAEGSLIFSVASLASFMIAIPAKKWVKSIGIINATKLALLLDAIACTGYSYCPPTREGYNLLILFSLLFGLGVGLKSISLNLIINVAYIGPHKRKVFSGLHSMYGISSLLAPQIVNLLYLQGYSWNIVFRFMAIFPLITFLYFIKLKPKAVKLPEAHEDGNLPLSLIAAMGILLSFYVASEIIVSSRLVLFLQEVHGYSESLSSIYLSLFFGGLLAGRLFFSFKEVSLSSLSLLKISALTTICLVLLGTQYHPVFLSLCGLSMSFFFPCAMSFISEHFSQMADLLMARSMQIVGFSLVSFHYIFGLISTYSTVESAMLLPVLLLGISSAIMFFDRRLVEAWGRD